MGIYCPAVVQYRDILPSRCAIQGYIAQADMQYGDILPKQMCNIRAYCTYSIYNGRDFESTQVFIFTGERGLICFSVLVKKITTYAGRSLKNPEKSLWTKDLLFLGEAHA